MKKIVGMILFVSSICCTADMSYDINKVMLGDNLVPNPSAERVIKGSEFSKIFKVSRRVELAEYVPDGWGFYCGDGYCKWGVTEEQAHRGSKSGFVKFLKFRTDSETKKRFKTNFGICFGNTDLYTGKSAIRVKGNTKYYYSFYLKGDVPEIRIRSYVWTTEQAGRGDMKKIFVGLGKSAKPAYIKYIFPTGRWVRYGGVLTTPADAKYLTIVISVCLGDDKLKQGQSFYVDDLELRELIVKRSLSSATKDEVSESLKVGIYDAGRYNDKKYIYKAIKGCKGICPSLIDNLKAETIKKYDVLIFSVTKRLSQKDEIAYDNGIDWRMNLLNYVDSGGGIILCHDCVGLRGVFGRFKLFPDIGVGEKRIKNNNNIYITDTKNPVMKNIQNPFKCLYVDHIGIKKGPIGRILAKDEEGYPVVVIGDLSRGRIVFTGIPFAWRYKKVNGTIHSFTERLTDTETQLLSNMIRWAGKGIRYEVPMCVTYVTLYERAKNYNIEAARERQIADSKWSKLPEPKFDESWIYYHLYNGKDVYIPDTESKIANDMKLIKQMGFTGVRAYIYNLYAYYDTHVARKDILTNAHSLKSLSYKQKIGEQFDPARIICEQARKNGLKVCFIVSPFRTYGYWKSYATDLTEAEARELKSGKSIDEIMRTTRSAYRYWACPDHPKVRERAIAIMSELIKRYHPAEIGLDYIRYKDDFACFCEYSVKARESFAKKHPEMSKNDIISQFAKNSIVGFVKDVTTACKALDGNVKIFAYSHPDWANEFPVDYQSQRVSRGLYDTWGTLERIYRDTDRLCKWARRYYPHCIPAPFVDLRDNKSFDRIYMEFKIFYYAETLNKIETKVGDAFSYSMIVDKQGKANLRIAKALSKALNGTLHHGKE